jgi:peptidoglycan/xylan/chitin deacetylase (PgdA/CDA1 family)
MNPMQPALTVIMYHYVRPIAYSRYPRIKGLELVDFEGQLDYLQRHYNLVSMQTVLDAANGAVSLPPSPVLLTFDDGYTDHFAHVFPALLRRKATGVFFPPVGAIRDRVVLDVNKIHFVLQCQSDLSAVIALIDKEVVALELGEPEKFHATYRKPSRYDTPDTMYVKRMLQFALPEMERARIVQHLFAEFVSTDEHSFADELYATEENWRDMIDAGMSVGGHGFSHSWLNKLSPTEQEDEITQSRAWLNSLGATRQHFVFCYPFGGYNQDTKDILKAQGCSAAFTTKVGLARAHADDMLDLQRLDTNDLPRHGDAPPASWTEQARSTT